MVSAGARARAKLRAPWRGRPREAPCGGELNFRVSRASEVGRQQHLRFSAAWERICRFGGWGRSSPTDRALLCPPVFRSFDDIEVSDIPLEDYIAAKAKTACFLPHSAQRYQQVKFRKATCPIVERMVCSLMYNGEYCCM